MTERRTPRIIFLHVLLSDLNFEDSGGANSLEEGLISRDCWSDAVESTTFGIYSQFLMNAWMGIYILEFVNKYTFR